MAARRICQGKWASAGATCTAPDDHLIVEAKSHDKVVGMLQRQLVRCFTEISKMSPDYGSVLNEAHLKRLAGYIDDAVQRGAKVVCGHGAGEPVDVEGRCMAPTTLADAPLDALIMHEEIFGPILPVIKMGASGVVGGQGGVEGMIHGAIDMILSKEKPLACHVFTSRASVQRPVVARVQAGSMVISGAVVHALVPDMPFGGVGASGMRNHHGREGFRTFSHAKAVLKHDTATDFLTKFRHPPFSRLAGRIFPLVMGKAY